MRKRFISYLMASVIIITGLFLAPAPLKVSAGNVLTGEYVAVVNTDTVSRTTGMIEFDENIATGASASIAEPEGLLADHDVLYAEDGADSSAFSRKGSRAGITYQIGDTGSYYGGKQYVCIGIGKECYVWMEQALYNKYSSENRTKAGKEIADMYDGRPYEIISELSGNQDFYKDGSGKLSIMVSDISNSTGFYGNENSITAIYIKSIAANSYYPGAYRKYDGLLVHETQHAIFRWLACNGDAGKAYQLSWLNEGLSVAAMDYYWGGEDPTGWLSLINDNVSIRNGSSLVYDAYRNSSVQDYSMPYLFVRYLANQKEKGYHPVSMIKSFYNGGMTGDTVAYVNSVFKGAGLKDKNGSQLTYEEALANFYVAAAAQENTGVYGFYGDSVVKNVVSDYPIYAGESGQAVKLAGSAAIILKTKDGSFKVPDDADSHIQFIPFTKQKDVKLPNHGSGTPGDPYLIETADDFTTVASASDACFRLANSIDVSTVTAFPPAAFTGTFDGAGYTITGMTKPLVLENQGVIKNLTVDGFSGEFRTWTGVLSNFNAGTISDCTVTGNVNVKFTSTTAFNLPSFGTMTAQNRMSGVITRCAADAEVTVYMPENTVYAGMIAGENKYEISDCYSRGTLTVTGPGSGRTLSTGGIIGEQYSSMYPKPILENCYSTTSVNVSESGGTVHQGQIAGYVQNESSVTGCYGLKNSLEAVGSGKTEGSSLKTEPEMKMQATYSGWAFGVVWQMPVGGYPVYYTPDAITVVTGNTEYYVGESLNLYGAKLNLGSGMIELTGDMVEGFDSSTAGTKTVTGNYKGKSFSFQVLVKEPVNVAFLEVYAKPQLSYVEGAVFNPAGTRLRATIDGRTNCYISSGYTVDKTGPLKAEDSKVTYTYGNATVQQAISVSPKTSQVQSLTVLNLPDKMTEYYEGDSLLLEGLKVQLKYKDGSKSAVFSSSELASQNLHISLGMDTEIQGGKVLQGGDHQKSLYVYYGDVMPKDSGSIYREIGALEVKKVLWMDDSVFDITVNKPSFPRSDSIQGVTASGVDVSVVSGMVPSGLSVTYPNGGNNYRFVVDGIATKVETSDVVYKITDKGNGRSINVKITFRINPPSAACDIEQVTVRQALNAQAVKYMGIIDKENAAVTVTVPDNFNVTNSVCSIETSAGATGGGTFSDADFTSAKEYVITAEDGITKKTYRIQVVKSPSQTQLSSPGNLKWNVGRAEWDSVSGADGYIVALYDSSDRFIKSFMTEKNECDLAPAFTKKAEYYFTVIAYKADNSMLNSEEIKSPSYTLKPEIRSITISPSSADVKVGNNVVFTAAVEGIGGHSTEVVWSISGAVSQDTKIVSGNLNVGADETAAELTIRAASVQDSNKYAEAVVGIKQLVPLQKPGNLVWNQTAAGWNAVTGAQGYRVTLLKDGTEVGATKEITGTSHNFAADMTASGNYTFLVQAFGAGFLDSETMESPVNQISPSIKKEPSAGDFVLDKASDVYSKGQQGVTVTLAPGISGMGSITVKYNGKQDRPSQAGDYKITVDILEGTEYTAKRELELGSYQIEPKVLTDIKVKAPSVKQDSMPDNTNVQGIVCSIISPQIYEGDTVGVTGDMLYPSVQETGIFADDKGAVFTVTKEPGNKNYSLLVGTVIQGVEYEVTDKAVTGITIVNQPDKTEYYTGEAFDKSGIRVEAIWEYGDNTDITEFITIVTDTPLQENSKVKVEYHAGTNVFWEELPVVIKERQLTGISIVQHPDKTEYLDGESFLPDGMMLSLAYDHGENQTVSYSEETKDGFICTPERLTTDITKVDVQYQNQHAQQEITVKRTTYPVIEGSDAEWIPGDSEQGLTVRVDMQLEDFREVLINDEILDSVNYTVKSGSTVITLMPQYLQTLEPDTYVITVVFRGGDAKTSFTVKKEVDAENPGTDKNPGGEGPDGNNGGPLPGKDTDDGLGNGHDKDVLPAVPRKREEAVKTGDAAAAAQGVWVVIIILSLTIGFQISRKLKNKES